MSNHLCERLIGTCRNLAGPMLTVLAWVVIPLLVVAQTFSPTGNLNTGRNAHRAVMLNDGTVLIVGGYDLSANALSSMQGLRSVAAAFVDNAGVAANIGRIVSSTFPSRSHLFASHLPVSLS